MAVDPKDIATLTPKFLSTLYKHFKNEVPDSNWDLKLHISVIMLKSFLERSRHKTIERQQKLSKAHMPSPPSIAVKKNFIPETCRSQAEDIMSGLLSGKEEKIGWRWKEDICKQQPIKAEWVEAKNRKKITTVDRVILYIHGGAYFLGSAAQHRFLIQKVVKASAARAFSVDYRLAPQSPFPAALVDMLAAYLYLIQPPTDAGFEPINPQNIVVMGDSAGGGLTIALLMVLRDAGLPQPVGGVCWVDLYHSLPSIFDNSTTDYIPNGFVHKASPANPIKDYTDVQQRLDRIQYYAYNSALDLPYVSPIMADDLGGLGQLYITCGNGERLRDEASPRKHSYLPTKVELNIFEAMPHVFQLFIFHPSSISSIQRTGAFIRKAIPEKTVAVYNSFSNKNFSPLLPLLLPPSSLLVSSNINTIDISFPIDEIDDLEEDISEFFVSKYIDCKGVCKTKNHILDEVTLHDWLNRLGKLPDFSLHPEFLEL
ncbi:1655_t:CDS:2 [Entrophospora sp. SA101]|nr:13312_t:CDS:2 [Entrophospora sp. SA101]CAJ0634637.1 14536_t:CDS:2 [Entrophospora sp. SA101]CAJ0756763.1 15609_t:CDS:2 [Entrophospora sp. SA101]CAJ0764256.1 1655_t:CDS:2 [Entrophospora sp. SA101]CAJ0831040.1 9956_t:CDS:2 [Entrophospora sp. SA101]